MVPRATSSINSEDAIGPPVSVQYSEESTPPSPSTDAVIISNNKKQKMKHRFNTDTSRSSSLSSDPDAEGSDEEEEADEDDQDDEEEEQDAEGSPEDDDDDEDFEEFDQDSNPELSLPLPPPEEEEDDDDEKSSSSGSEMDLDSDDQQKAQSAAASVVPEKQPTTNSVTPPSESATKKPLVLKLKLAAPDPDLDPDAAATDGHQLALSTTNTSKMASTSTSAATTKRKYVRKAPLKKNRKGRPPKASGTSSTSLGINKVLDGEGKTLKRKDTDEEDELAEEEVGSSVAGGGLYQAWDESDESDDGEGSNANPNSLTVRQRAKEFGSQVADLQSLPMKEAKKNKVELTEADRAMEKAEKSRKRKHQNEKKLEDEKTETINRLLKGQVGKASRARTEIVEEMPAGTGGANSTATVSKVASSVEEVRQPKLIRYVSSIRTGEYVAGLSFPISQTITKGGMIV